MTGFSHSSGTLMSRACASIAPIAASCGLAARRRPSGLWDRLSVRTQMPIRLGSLARWRVPITVDRSKWREVKVFLMQPPFDPLHRQLKQ